MLIVGAFTLDLLLAKLVLKMEISMFDEEDNAYRLVLCTEKCFVAKGTSEAQQKVSKAVTSL